MHKGGIAGASNHPLTLFLLVTMMHNEEEFDCVTILEVGNVYESGSLLQWRDGATVLDSSSSSSGGYKPFLTPCFS